MEIPASPLVIFILRTAEVRVEGMGGIGDTWKESVTMPKDLHLLFVLSSKLTAHDSTKLLVFEPAQCSAL